MRTVEPAAARPATTGGRFAERTYWALLLGLPAVAAVLPITSGFWLDETGTYWLIRGGIGDIARRCAILPQSILYTALMWAIDLIAGHSGIVFRLPSVIATAVAAYLLFRLARDEFGREVGLTAATLFASTPEIIFAACDARPYALGVLSVTAAAVLLLLWMRTGRLACGLAYATAAALIIHFHFLFAPVLIPHAVYVLLAARRHRIRMVHVGVAGVCFVVLLAPLGWQFAELARTRVARSYEDAPTAAHLVFTLLPAFVAVPSLISLLVAGAGLRVRRPQRLPRLVLIFVVGWAVVPPVFLWGLSVASATHVFIPRFLVSAAPGLALLFAIILASPRWLVLRRCLLALCVATGLYGAYAGQFLFNHAGKRGDYRTALTFIERNASIDSAPVLIRSQYIESDFINWRSARISDDVLFSPLGYYRTNADFFPLPLSITPEVETYLRAFAASQRARNRRFLLMSFRGPRPLPPFLEVLRASLPGWRDTQIGDFRGILVYEFRPQQAR